MFFFRSFSILFTKDSFVIGGNIDNVLVILGGGIVTIESLGRHCQFGSSLKGVYGLFPK
jgi:hypothetical protein